MSGAIKFFLIRHQTISSMSTSQLFRLFWIMFCVSQDLSTARWEKIHKKCIQIRRSKLSYSQAKSSCEQQKTFLFSIKNQEELIFITNLQKSANMWVGLYQNSSTKKWYWDDGSEFMNPKWWFRGNPQNYAVAFFREGTLRGAFPSNPLWYICERKANYRKLPIDVSQGVFGFCGVEIMSNCDGLPCEDICFFHPDCNRYAKVANVCVNIKNTTQTDNCIIKLSSPLKLYSLNAFC